MDIEEQAGTRGLKYAADKGLAVVIMEPIRGGALAGHVPPAVQALWDSSPTRRTAADWALQWLRNQPKVSIVLSGMSTMQQVVDNVASAERSGAGTLRPQELAVVDCVRAQYQSLRSIPCTRCQYCLPCPNSVAIPDMFGIYADACIECGECLEKCPQHIDTPDWLKVAHEALATHQP